MSRIHRVIGAMLAIAAFAGAAAALASPQFKQTSTITLTAKKAKASTGFQARIASSDPGNPGNKPQALKTLTVTFPPSTKFNFKSSAIKQCTASLAELVGSKGAACPAKSKIGSGSAAANGAPVFPSIPETVTVYAGKGKLLFVLLPAGAVGSTIVLEGAVSANKLTATVPQLSSGGLPIVITELKVSVKTLGSGKQAFVTAGQCNKGKFTVKSSFVYYTGSPLTLSSSSSCSK